SKTKEMYRLLFFSIIVLSFSLACDNREQDNSKTEGKNYRYDSTVPSPTGNISDRETHRPNEGIVRNSTFKRLQSGGETTGLMIKTNDTDAQTTVWNEGTGEIINGVEFNRILIVSPGYQRIESKNRRTGELRETRVLVRGGEIMEATIYF